MRTEKRLEISLAIIRISTAIFLLVWSTGKLLAPALTQNIFSKFYFSEISLVMSYAVGVLQTILVLLFLVGLYKTFSYGVVLGMHSVSVLSTYEKLFNPYYPPNILFWAGVPVLAGLVALFLLRDHDHWLTLQWRAFTSSNSIKSHPHSLP